MTRKLYCRQWHRSDPKTVDPLGSACAISESPKSTEHVHDVVQMHSTYSHVVLGGRWALIQASHLVRSIGDLVVRPQTDPQVIEMAACVHANLGLQIWLY